jgi:Flp pilus assembly protein TadD
MKDFPRPVCLALVGLLVLGGCTPSPVNYDPLAVNGRDGGGKPVTYAELMRIGAAAHAGGDLANAVSIYRRAEVLAPTVAAPFIAAGNVLMELGRTREAIISYNSALARARHDPEALRGLAKAYLHTGRPELANVPLALAYAQTPLDPKLLLLIGVANDMTGHHHLAQQRYQRGLQLLPGDPALSVDFALSLALSGNYAEAIGVLQPIAGSALSTPRERQTLALIYGLQGNDEAAARLGRMDLDPASVQHNLAYYATLRNLSPQARDRAILSASLSRSPAAPPS